MTEALFSASFGSAPRIARRTNQIALIHPRRIKSAYEPCDVIPLIREAERDAITGSWVALVLSYEAAPAFDPALRVHQSGDFPLAWSATFESASPWEQLTNSPTQKLSCKPSVTFEEYEKALSRIQQHIIDGQCYQVNYTFPLTTSIQVDARDWFHQLCRAQTRSFAAYLDLDRFKLLSLSPELFFARKDRRVSTRPMKGTAKRGRWSEEDVELANDLSNSAKDRAENVMIVDLLRNDLGRVSLPGSISVRKLFQVEKYETLWQMTSTIESVLRPGVDLAQIFTALFPCGSVTGAPKIRTMEIINDLECFPRGVYTGAIGLLRPGGDCIFNVAIRTIVIDERQGQMTFGVGSGVTIDSIAAREYEECLVKASFLQYQAIEFDLLETLLLEDGEIFLQQRHQDRLVKSANYFGFTLDQAVLTGSLERLRYAHSTGRWKVRLLVSPQGDIRIEIGRLEPATDQTLRVKLAPEPVDSREQSLFHKTTNRAVYDRATASLPDFDDVVLWNEREEITESTIANIVASIDGKLITPPLACGLLPGTFRAELLATGKIHERVIHKEELLSIKSFYLINSVKRWQSALLVS